jgi:transposase-like protein
MTSPFYSGYRFPSDIIQRAIWLYLRFTLSYRDVEELLAERGVKVSSVGSRCLMRPSGAGCSPLDR